MTSKYQNTKRYVIGGPIFTIPGSPGVASTIGNTGSPFLVPGLPHTEVFPTQIALERIGSERKRDEAHYLGALSRFGLGCDIALPRDIQLEGSGTFAAPWLEFDQDAIEDCLLPITPYRELTSGHTHTVYILHQLSVDDEVFSRIESLLRTIPIESGMTHPAEEMFDSLFQIAADRLLAWITKLVQDPSPQNLQINDLVMLLGRSIAAAPRSARDLSVFRIALNHPNMEVRYAAVRSLELIGSPDSFRFLAIHSERETDKWLKSLTIMILTDANAGTGD